MKNSNHITTIEKRGTMFQIDANRTATAKQLYALSQKWGKAASSDDSQRFGLAKVFYAILKKYQLEHSSTPITQSDVERFFEADDVPQKFAEQIISKPKKTSKKSATSKKPTATKKPTTSKKSTATKAQPAASTQSVEDFKARIEALGNRVTKVEKKTEAHEKSIAQMEAKLDILMAYLETDADRMNY